MTTKERYMIAEPYFLNEDGLIREFEFDYEQINEFDLSLFYKYALMFAPFMVTPCGIMVLLFGPQNIIDQNNAQHVCITQDGIRYSVDKHKTGCRCDCLDEGRVTKTVPFDKITDCDLKEPAGSSGPICCMVKNVLTTVVVDTASSGQVAENGIQRHELQLTGLKDAQAFKKLVWQTKRELQGKLEIGSAMPPASRTNRSTPAGIHRPPVEEMTREEVVPLLQEQIRILEEHTDLLRVIAAK